MHRIMSRINPPKLLKPNHIPNRKCNTILDVSNWSEIRFGAKLGNHILFQQCRATLGLKAAQGRRMKDIHAVIREKEQQVRQLMEQIDKLRCAAQILEDENPLGVAEEPVRAASIPKPAETPRAEAGKRWP